MPVSIRLIGSCPVAKGASSGKAYLSHVASVSKWAEESGWDGLLIYTDNRQLDPWLVAQFILQQTTTLRPLIALQPLYMHPFSVAKNIMTLGLLYERQLHLNFVAGGFPRDLESLCDELPHDARYERVIEYGLLVRELLSASGLTSFGGKHYSVKNLQLMSKLPAALLPGYMISGSSAAGAAAARKLDACAIQYLKPPHEYEPAMFAGDGEHGTRLGIMVRESAEEAQLAARRRFVESPEGASIRTYASSISDSVWVKELAKAKSEGSHGCYWLAPYQNAQASSPFLVGSRADVATYLRRYMQLGITTFLLEEPEDAEDSHRISEVFRLAAAPAEPVACSA